MEIACCTSADGADDAASGNADAVFIGKNAVRNLSSWRQKISEADALDGSIRERDNSMPAASFGRPEGQ
jgi:NAD(P)H-dependent FMN reductase